jgi:hypothetical protein
LAVDGWSGKGGKLADGKLVNWESGKVRRKDERGKWRIENRGMETRRKFEGGR